MVVTVGGDEGTWERPEGEEAIIDDVEALGLVAEVVLAAGATLACCVLCSRGVGGGSGLIACAAVVEDIGSEGCTEKFEVAVSGMSMVNKAGFCDSLKSPEKTSTVKVSRKR